ncbi:hypothetical protein LZ31DRAFT_282509 [Colletotrichum somersetense]|nr:hypothetical protein LZ31DRAFT_282509 [Colletotrichum somersetense]
MGRGYGTACSHALRFCFTPQTDERRMCHGASPRGETCSLFFFSSLYFYLFHALLPSHRNCHGDALDATWASHITAESPPRRACPTKLPRVRPCWGIRGFVFWGPNSVLFPSLFLSFFTRQ